MMPRSPRSVLAAIAVVLAAGAVFAGTPFRARDARIDVTALARMVEHEDDHVTAVDLARWIKERRPDLRVIDVRSAQEFDAYHVPTAERIPLDSLASADLRREQTLVLYSEGGAHAAQGWVFLRALGFEHVYFLRGGLYEWLDDVMNPSLSAGAPPSEAARFDTIAALSRYFGGVPHRNATMPFDQASPAAPPSEEATTAALVHKVRRRGC